MAFTQEEREGAKQAARGMIYAIRFTEDYSPASVEWLNSGISMLFKYGLTVEDLRSVSLEEKDAKARHVRQMLRQI